jgi:hypothetical protein
MRMPTGTTSPPGTELPETQCRYCSTIMVFMGHTASGRAAEWMCPACRSVTTRRLVRGTYDLPESA